MDRKENSKKTEDLVAEFAKITADKENRNIKNNESIEKDDDKQSYSPPSLLLRKTHDTKIELDIKNINDVKTYDVKYDELKFMKSPDIMKKIKVDTPDKKSDSKSIKGVETRITKLDEVPLPGKDGDTSNKSDDDNVDKKHKEAGRKSRSTSRSTDR